MIWTAVEIITNIFQAILILFFIKSRLHIQKQSLIADCSCIASCALFYSLYLFVDIPINDICIFIFPFIYALWISSDQWPISLFWTIILSVLFNSTVGAASHIFAGVFEIRLSSLMMPSCLRLAFLLFTNSILFCVIYLASKLQRDSLYMSWPSMLTFLLISISILVIEECLYNLQKNSDNPPLFYCIAYAGLLSCTILSILLFRFLSESSSREHEYKSEINTYMLTQKHHSEFTTVYSDFVSREHDFKHHLETIEHLIKQSNCEAASSYLASYKSTLPDSRLFMTGSIEVDALLTAKYYTMKAHQINFHFTPHPLHSLPISSSDFCSIVGNLLDNAIEGSLRIPSPSSPLTISLTFARTYDVFHIMCENACNPNTIRKQQNRWISSKIAERLPVSHGIGISSIERIVDKAEGHCRFHVQNDIFSAELTIPYPAHSRQGVPYDSIC